jgi:hypothetical protein
MRIFLGKFDGVARKALAIVLTLAASIMCHGLGRADGAPGALPPQVGSDGGGFLLTLSSRPAPIPLNELFEIEVSVDASAAADDSSNPVWLRASAEMPAHKHGMNTRVIVEQLEDGRFLLKGLLFHMRGEWLITFDVAKGRVHEQAKVLVQL